MKQGIKKETDTKSREDNGPRKTTDRHSWLMLITVDKAYYDLRRRKLLTPWHIF